MLCNKDNKNLKQTALKFYKNLNCRNWIRAMFCVNSVPSASNNQLQKAKTPIVSTNRGRNKMDDI